MHSEFRILKYSTDLNGVLKASAFRLHSHDKVAGLCDDNDINSSTNLEVLKRTIMRHVLECKCTPITILTTRACVGTCLGSKYVATKV